MNKFSHAFFIFLCFSAINSQIIFCMHKNNSIEKISEIKKFGKMYPTPTNKKIHSKRKQLIKFAYLQNSQKLKKNINFNPPFDPTKDIIDTNFKKENNYINKQKMEIEYTENETIKKIMETEIKEPENNNIENNTDSFEIYFNPDENMNKECLWPEELSEHDNNLNSCEDDYKIENPSNIFHQESIVQKNITPESPILEKLEDTNLLLENYEKQKLN